MKPHTDLSAFFAPRGVAVIGASRDERKLGYGVLHNLVQHGFSGSVYPVNPKADEILGQPCYPSIRDVPDPVDLAVIVLPAHLILPLMEDCGQRGLYGVIVISGGFREIGPEGAQREEELIEIAQRYGMRLMGPNGIGVIDTITRLNTTFVAGMPERGNIAFISQSGAIGGGILDWAQTDGVGFSRFISLGNQADVTEMEVLAFLGEDPHTRVITMYLEGVADGRSFMDAAKRIAREKPIIVLKVGTTEAGARAATSHTGALAGTTHVYRAAFRQCGILQAESVEDLFDWARICSAYQQLAGDDVVVVTNAGGPSVVAADGVEHAGLQLASLQTTTQDRLRSILAPHASVKNPVDMLGGAGGSTYRRVMATVLEDPDAHGVVVIHVPQALVSPEAVAQGIGEALVDRSDAKPVVACYFGGVSVQSARRVVRKSYGIPDYGSPGRATRALGVLARRRRWLAQPQQSPPMFTDVDTDSVRQWLKESRAAGRQILNDHWAFNIAAAYQIPIASTRLARTSEEAVRHAGDIGYPVALKAVAPGVVHRTEMDGLVLGVRDRQGVDAAFRRLKNEMAASADTELDGVLVQEMVSADWEVIAGFTRDPQFGPVVMYGLGGIYVEMLDDVSFRVAPLTEADARAMIEETRSARLLKGVRGRPPTDIKAIIDCLLRLSQLALDCPQIGELDINPLMVNEARVVAVDVRLAIGEEL